MSEQFDRLARTRVQALYSYTIALEHGDAETLARVLQEAEQDAVLERMILELHDASLTEGSEPVTEQAHVLAEQDDSDQKKRENTMAIDGNFIINATYAEPIQLKNRKPSRVVEMFQALAAVLIVGALVSSFALLLAHHPGSLGNTRRGQTGPIVQKQNFIVVVADNSGMIYGLHSTDGTVLWQFKADEQEVDTMVQQNGAVYISTSNGKGGNHLYKLRLSDGKLLWKKDFPQQSGFSTIVVDGKAIAISGSEGEGSMDVVRTTDGSLLWHYAPQTGTGRSIWVNPMIVERNNVIYIRIYKGMQALQLDSGKLLWTSYASPVVDTLVFSNNVIYTVNMLSWQITALNPQNGKFLKRIQLHFPSQTPLTEFGHSNDALYVSTQMVSQGITHTQICATRLDDGTTLWCMPDMQNVTPYSFLSMNSNIYYMQVTQDGGWQVDASNAKNATPLWHWTNPDGNTFSSMNSISIVGANGIVFVTSPQGFFALSSNNGHLLWKALPGFHTPLFALPAVPNQQQNLPS